MKGIVDWECMKKRWIRYPMCLTVLPLLMTGVVILTLFIFFWICIKDIGVSIVDNLKDLGILMKIIFENYFEWFKSDTYE